MQGFVRQEVGKVQPWSAIVKVCGYDGDIFVGTA